MSLQSLAQHLRNATQQLSLASETAALDARILLEQVIQKNRIWLLAHQDELLQEEQASQFYALVQRRAQHEPVAYLTGHKEFYGRNFRVNPHVLVPRPETELLIDLVLGLPKRENLRILDLGTGSGCIAITLALEFAQRGVLAAVTAVDFSREALVVAQKNAEQLQAQVNFIESNWFSSLPEGAEFDVIVANPPYIQRGAPGLSPELVFEPEHALYSEDSGMKDLAILLEQFPRWLAPQGDFLSEIGWDQGAQVLRYQSYHDVEVIKDLAGKDRVVKIAWNKQKYLAAKVP